MCSGIHQNYAEMQDHQQEQQKRKRGMIVNAYNDLKGDAQLSDSDEDSENKEETRH